MTVTNSGKYKFLGVEVVKEISLKMTVALWRVFLCKKRGKLRRALDHTIRKSLVQA
jgi:hypothetical protein